MEKRTHKKEKKRVNFKKEFSAGGVVYKREKENILWLITKSAPSDRIPKSVWRLPKGWIDDDSRGGAGVFASGKEKAKENDIRKAAVREVEEEGGVKVKVIRKLDTVRFFFVIGNVKVMKFVTFYIMEWTSDLPGGYGPESEEVGFFPYNKARQKLEYSSEKKILDKAEKLVRQGVQQSLV